MDDDPFDTGWLDDEIGGWGMHAKPVPENPDGTPRRSLLADLAQKPASGITEEAPGRYRSVGTYPYPRG